MRFYDTENENVQILLNYTEIQNIKNFYFSNIWLIIISMLTFLTSCCVKLLFILSFYFFSLLLSCLNQPWVLP